MAADSSEAESSEAGLSKGTADSAADSTAAAPTPTVDHSGAESPSPASDAEPEPASAGAEPAALGTADEPATESSGYPPALIATAVALPVVLVVAVLVAAVLALRAPTEREPLVLGPVPAPAADGPACAALLPALPVDLGDYSKSTLVEPAPPATRAWQRKDGGDAIVLRCGLERPLEFNRASPLQIVNGVQWFEVRDAAAKASTWFAVDRATYIALTVPDGSGPTPLQGVSDTITANIPAQPIDPGPLPN
ncbi:DUF3515 domain-containing protein [Nocardia pseudovaccinii]|uniref:DUF3515 domain-containing protein n=1 Tax=Nocardia pseudovaccinii TaxID=189540 RepID=UPI0007A45921|nr:DUF3515 domain-containing protein [Nocardia pseudovaccinii]